MLPKALAAKNINLRGMMYHGGIPRRAGYFREETEELMDYLGQAKARFDWDCEYLNIGGGFLPARQGVSPAPPNIDTCAKEIATTIAQKSCEHRISAPKLILEPGRYCWESAITWLTQVGTIKEDRSLAHKTWAYVDGITNDLRDPFDPHGRHHEVIIANDANRPVTEVVDICGGLCNADDVLAAGRRSPKLRKRRFPPFSKWVPTRNPLPINTMSCQDRPRSWSRTDGLLSPADVKQCRMS